MINSNNYKEIVAIALEVAEERPAVKALLERTVKSGKAQEMFYYVNEWLTTTNASGLVDSYPTAVILLKARLRADGKSGCYCQAALCLVDAHEIYEG